MNSNITSKILWHLTGGPKWNVELKCRETTPKSDEEASSNLNNILKSNLLKASSIPETIKYFNPSGPGVGLVLPPICCVAEIPIPFLKLHCNRYGKFGIGFSRNKLIEKRFRPVNYCLDREDFITSSILNLSLFIENLIDTDEQQSPHLKKENLLDYIHNIECFTKTFSLTELETVYCEREWRGVGNLIFDDEDVKSILVPKSYREKYLEILKIKKSSSLLIYEDMFE
jgi:hypothetical protein